MNNSEIIGPSLRAIAAIAAGDVNALESVIAAHPELVHSPLDFSELRALLGASLFEEGYFRQPYLLWFVAENPVRTGQLPKNIAQVTQAIIEGAKRAHVETLQHQIDYTLSLVCSGRVSRECGVQRKLIDVLVNAGADVDGTLVPALAHCELAAAEHLLERGATLTLLAAVCTGRMDDARRLGPLASSEARQLALAGAALYGKTEALTMLIDLGADVNAFCPHGFHPHATVLHNAVSSGSLDAVTVLVEAGADIRKRDRLYQGPPLGWAIYGKHAEIVAYIREALAKVIIDKLSEGHVFFSREQTAEAVAIVAKEIDH
ncbi:MAG TPA: ankyrin repeat domain-containing protein [Pyrinomonadaceae bacterium]|nr:ankyrin repeat domain-containing protein [Pyrinomonadaceae bacterium]